MGSLQPDLVSHFTDAVQARFAPIRRKLTPIQTGQTSSNDERVAMPLADGITRSEYVPQSATAPIFNTQDTGFPALGEPVAPISRSIQPSVSEKVQRKEAESAPLTPAVQDVRAALERSLAARRSATVPSPVRVNPPRPSLNQVRRVARVEEFDPISMAEQNLAERSVSSDDAELSEPK
ncbi:MAG TPA: hypothetical protein VGK87_15320, partial [Anaerolineae bacterium]